MNQGYYTLVEGDTPRNIASVVYGDGNMYQSLLVANPKAEWTPGEQVVIPNKLGRTTTVQQGESAQDVVHRLFPDQYSHMYIQRFISWNGGATLREGQFVFCPDR